MSEGVLPATAGRSAQRAAVAKLGRARAQGVAGGRFGGGRWSAWPWLALLPSLALLAVFGLVPFVWAFTTSFYRYEVGGESEWVGLDNYVEYLTADPTLLASVGHMLFFTAVGLAASLTVPLVAAKLIFEVTRLHRGPAGERLAHGYRVLFLIPIVVPGVAVQMIWSGGVYADDGLLDSLFSPLGIEAGGLLVRPATAMLAVAMVGFPFAQGINVLIFYAGFAEIPESVHEAATLDGASGVRKFLSVDVPMLLSQVKLLAILAMIAGIQGFEGVFIMTRGGPGFETMVPGLWMYYNAFSFQRMGYACAIGVMLFLLVLAVTFANTKLLRSSQDLQR